METGQKRSGWKIWVYLSPVYIFLGVTLFKWTNTVDPGNVKLSNAEYGAFNAYDGEVKKREDADYDPGLNDIGYSVRYRSAKNRPAKPPQIAKASPPRALTVDEEYLGMGSRKGFLTYAVGKLLDRPKEVAELFNNALVVKGFMNRGAVKAALDNPQELQNYLKNTAEISGFLTGSVVQSAINRPEVVRAFATSAMADAILASPGVQGLIKNTEALTELAENDQQMMQFLSNPNVRNALRNNPQTAALAASLGGG